jgi:hypothetical protein
MPDGRIKMELSRTQIFRIKSFYIMRSSHKNFETIIISLMAGWWFGIFFFILHENYFTNFYLGDGVRLKRLGNKILFICEEWHAECGKYSTTSFGHGTYIIFLFISNLVWILSRCSDYLFPNPFIFPIRKIIKFDGLN